jgi:soluble lytic murein transglycosylase-like protein
MALKRRPQGARQPVAPVNARAGTTAAVAGERAGTRDLWRKGLAAWRAGDDDTAADRFSRLADDERLDGETLARAAFWAARANLRAGRPQQVARFLRLAARGSDEFYGLLAQKTLDERIDFDWHEDQLKTSMLDLLVRFLAAQRAIALGQVGERELAEDEVRRLAERARPELAQALMTLAATLELPALQMKLAPQVRKADGRRHDGARYPLPRWQPTGGYRLDPSLVHAVIRAESGFDPRARSPKGALGLMQVMPDTARHVAKLTKVAYRGEGWLLHPPNNMAVGQAWLQQLAASKTVDRSLIRLVTAYNAGEGRLIGWLAKELEGLEDDPLLVVESVPIAETRSYVKKVLGNLWAYQARLGEPSPSLQALAENRWPDVPPAGKAPAAKPVSKSVASAD